MSLQYRFLGAHADGTKEALLEKRLNAFLLYAVALKGGLEEGVFEVCASISRVTAGETPIGEIKLTAVLGMSCTFHTRSQTPAHTVALFSRHGAKYNAYKQADTQV